jgi:hypothetical protein
VQRERLTKALSGLMGAVELHELGISASRRARSRCTECDARWLPADEDCWEADLTDGEPPELVFYCRSQCEPYAPVANR